MYHHVGCFLEVGLPRLLAVLPDLQRQLQALLGRVLERETREVGSARPVNIG